MKRKFLSVMHVPGKYVRAGIITIAVLLVILITGIMIAYNKRESILQATLQKAIRKAKTEYHLNLSVDKARFDGLQTVVFDNITVVPENRDSLAHISKLRVGVKLFPLLFGNVKFGELELSDGRISLIKRDSLRNYDFLFRKKNQDTTARTKLNLAELANNLLNKLLNKIPDNMDIRNFDLSYVGNKDSLRFFVSTATIKNGELRSTIQVNNNESVWHAQGEVEPGDKQFDISLFAEGKKVELPLLKRKYDLVLNFDTIHAQLRKVIHNGDGLRLKGTYAIRNLLINQPKIAAHDIVVPSGSVDADLMIGENYVSVDSSSVIHLKNITAKPFIKYTLRPNKIYEVKLHTDELDAQELFNSFPEGLFESLNGIKVTGTLQYDLNFRLDTSNPDAVQFDSRLNKKNFKIVSWGTTPLDKINNTFVYTPYEYGKPMRDIIVGPPNPNFTPLDNISANLKNAVLTAEDPSFYSHRGFVEESIRKSIATDFKEKAFKRGASTISMQLVKNVYLNRQKTLARKIEEILLVWLIENNHISGKSRMFETYLNLIEWGRNVYGIGEASRYYFGKLPADLTLGESIFLASIVPRPKKGLYFFEPDGSLRGSLRGYFKLIGGLMARKGLTAPDTNAYGFYSVRLKESLRQQIAPDTISIDTLMKDVDDDADTRSFLDRIFGKKKEKTDTLSMPPAKQHHPVQQQPADTVKTPAELRRERREQRRQERKREREAGYR
ncbi:penicillin-binding protein (plasmid) [Pedobacter sp. BS3]|uniref:biosynthetic peptidoglycan transglycosylase n=1 Tax=Pedobacter sp. BS3 TaxID=2567937 RepID=UPI0011EBAE6B|nr:biosynthetic peptidoglycan transglycosylase [Pedobacter sp. BS3]TZF85850.1 penicillin-binding protein [Pedobacter sp. BS3]